MQTETVRCGMSVDTKTDLRNAQTNAIYCHRAEGYAVQDREEQRPMRPTPARNLSVLRDGESETLKRRGLLVHS